MPSQINLSNIFGSSQQSKSTLLRCLRVPLHKDVMRGQIEKNLHAVVGQECIVPLMLLDRPAVVPSEGST